MWSTSTLVEGFGDEVAVFLATILLASVVLMAWSLSSVSDRSWSRPSVRSHQQQIENDVEPTPSGNEGPEEHNTLSQQGDSIHSSVENEPQDNEETDSSQVTIKLKFLNDSHREVRSPLTERLGRFKQRHFAEDLAENKTVRLIFNGHVLSGDQTPLSQYGLFDNCVVHCLISRASTPQDNSNGSFEGESRPETDDLDFSHLCYPLLGSVLFMIWWCQMVYSHYFSFASTISLVSLTAIFLASLCNTYLY